MKSYEVRRTIAASPARVWQVLTDPSLLTQGGLGVIRIDGQIARGSRIKVWSEASPGRAFPVTVSEFEPERRMVWSGGMPFGLFTGVRQFTVRASGANAEFHMREEFSGPMLGLIWKSMPDLQPSFEKFADGLKKLAEGAAA